MFSSYFVMLSSKKIFLGGPPTWNHIDLLAIEEIDDLEGFEYFAVAHSIGGSEPGSAPHTDVCGTICLVDINPKKMLGMPKTWNLSKNSLFKKSILGIYREC